MEYLYNEILIDIRITMNYWGAWLAQLVQHMTRSSWGGKLKPHIGLRVHKTKLLIQVKTMNLKSTMISERLMQDSTYYVAPLLYKFQEQNWFMVKEIRK